MCVSACTGGGQRDPGAASNDPNFRRFLSRANGNRQALYPEGMAKRERGYREVRSDKRGENHRAIFGKTRKEEGLKTNLGEPREVNLPGLKAGA